MSGSIPKSFFFAIFSPFIDMTVTQSQEHINSSFWTQTDNAIAKFKTNIQTYA